MTWASFLSLSISSSTDETITPAFLLGGSVTWTSSMSDLISTFRSCGVNFFMTFDFAFIMLGSVAYLGWLSLKSVLQRGQRKQVIHNFHQTSSLGKLPNFLKPSLKSVLIIWLVFSSLVYHIFKFSNIKHMKLNLSSYSCIIE